MVANGKLPRGQTKVTKFTFQTRETRSLSFCWFVCNWSWPSIHLILSKFRSRISFLLICDFSLMQNRVSGTKTKHDLLDSKDIHLKKADKYINIKIRWSQHKTERTYSILNGYFDKLSKVVRCVGYCLEVSNKGDGSRLWDAWRRFLSFFLSAKAVRQLSPQVAGHCKQQREKL